MYLCVTGIDFASVYDFDISHDKELRHKNYDGCH
jgi:hypothetical protein